MLQFNACNDLLLIAESSLGSNSALQKKYLSNKHRFDIADCFPIHTDLTVKCRSQSDIDNHYGLRKQQTRLLFWAFQYNF